jgi:hypothetical protein
VILPPGNTNVGSITVPLTSCLTGLVCFANKKQKIVNCHTADSKPVKQEVNATVIHPPLVFPECGLIYCTAVTLTAEEHSAVADFCQISGRQHRDVDVQVAG